MHASCMSHDISRQVCDASYMHVYATRSSAVAEVTARRPMTDENLSAAAQCTTVRLILF